MLFTCFHEYRYSSSYLFLRIKVNGLLLCFRLCMSPAMLFLRIMCVRHEATRRKLPTPTLPRKKTNKKNTECVYEDTAVYISRMPQNKTKKHARHSSTHPPSSPPLAFALNIRPAAFPAYRLPFLTHTQHACTLGACRCEFHGCSRRPVFSSKGEKPRFCVAHKLDGMSDSRLSADGRSRAKAGAGRTSQVAAVQQRIYGNAAAAAAGGSLSGGAGGAGGGGSGLRASVGGTTRRNDRMRQSLISQTLGKRRSIGTKSMARTLAPSTPRHERGRTGRPGDSGQFDFSEEGEEVNGGSGR